MVWAKNPHKEGPWSHAAKKFPILVDLRFFPRNLIAGIAHVADMIYY